MNLAIDKIRHLNPCQEATTWLDTLDPETAWNTCTNPAWMLWLLEALNIDTRPLARRFALRVTHLWNCPDTVRQYLETGKKSLRDAAYAASAASRAASAASAAFPAASYAAYAASAASRAASRAASYAAYAASSAASSAASHAAFAASYAASSAAFSAASRATYAAYATSYAVFSAVSHAASEAEQHAQCEIIRELFPLESVLALLTNQNA